MGSGKSPIAKNNTFTKDESSAVDHYVSGDGMWINDYFRRNGDGYGELSKNEKEFIKDLDSAVNKPVNDKTLYRSVDARAIFGNDIDFDALESAVVYGGKDKYETAALQKATSRIGRTITEKGYMSTTRSASIAEEFRDYTGARNPVVMRIETAKHTKGRNVSNASKGIIESEKYEPQKETLLARNQSYVVKKLYSKNGQIYVDVKMK